MEKGEEEDEGGSSSYKMPASVPAPSLPRTSSAGLLYDSVRRTSRNLSFGCVISARNLPLASNKVHPSVTPVDSSSL